ncbi:MAG: hypothetical protein ACI81T_003808, partial [Bacteroidia bacterium]
MKSNLLIILLLAIFFSCQTKINKDDWEQSFAPRELPEATFTLSLEADTVIETEKGSVLFIPNNAFLDESGNVWNGNVELTISELNSVSELLEHNLPTRSESGVLSIEHVVNIKAFGDGKELKFNPKSAPYMEVPVSDDSDGLLTFKGNEDANGYVKWQKEKEQVKYLIPQPFETLDFLPTNFEETLISYLPYKGYKTPTKQLKDSLYFALEEVTQPQKVYIGEGSDVLIRTDSTSPAFCDGLSPAKVKTIQDKKFTSTFLATKAFEERLKVLIQIGQNELLELYINNLAKNLWEVDELVAKQLGESDFGNRFQNFSKEKLTNTKGLEKLGKSLSRFYQKQLAKNEKELAKASEAYRKELKKKSDLAQKKQEEYQKLLMKRQIYRLKKHGFRVKSNGYFCIAKEVLDLPKFELNVTVKNGKQFDRIQVYVQDPSIKSIFALLSDDKTHFDKCYDEDFLLLLKSNQNAFVTGIAYKDGRKYFVKQPFQQQKVVNVELEFPKQESDDKQLKQQLATFDKGARKFNKIEVDLEYQQFFADEREREEELNKETSMRIMLAQVSFPNCEKFKDLISEGKEIFEKNCSQCHAVNQEIVGPALRHIMRRRNFEWIVQMTQYPEKLIYSGDIEARKLHMK